MNLEFEMLLEYSNTSYLECWAIGTFTEESCAASNHRLRLLSRPSMQLPLRSFFFVKVALGARRWAALFCSRSQPSETKLKEK